MVFPIPDRCEKADTLGSKRRPALSGSLGLLLLLLIASIHIANISLGPPRDAQIRAYPVEEVIPVSSQLGLVAAWVVILVAWYQHRHFDGWPTITAVSSGFFVLAVFVFASGFPSIWMARFVLLVPYSLRLCFIALYPVLLHPIVAERILQTGWPAVVGRNPGVAGAVFVLGFPVACWLLRSVHISRDGYQCVEFTSLDIWHHQLREPLTILSHKVVASLLGRWPGLSAEESLAMLSCILGVPSLLLLARTVSIWAKETHSRPAVPFFLALASGGFTFLWLGHIEVYPVLVAGLCLLLFLVARYLSTGVSLFWPAVVFALLLPLHLSAAWLLPAMMYLLTVALKRNQAIQAVLAAGLIVALQVLIWGGICLVYYAGSWQAFWERFWSEMNVGTDKAMFLGWREIFSVPHAIDLIQELGYLSLPSLVGIVLLAIRPPKRPWNSQEVFTALAALGFTVYAITWRADRGFPEDYDLFCAFALFAPLAVGMRLAGYRIESGAFRCLFYLLVVSSLVLLSYQLFVHTQLDTHVEYLRHIRQMRELGLIE